jgi:glutaminyl-tRNA synthetase
LATVRILAIENLELDVDNFDDHKKQLTELKNTEKNEKVLDLLNDLNL